MVNGVTSPGKRLRHAMASAAPLQIVGAINAYHALLAGDAGFSAIYLSGAGVANASFGMPDIGLTTLANVAEDARRITAATALPLLVDIDTGFDDPAAAIRAMQAAGVAGVHMEDQVEAKKCGHLGGKQLVSTADMCGRIRSAVSGRSDKDFLLMARTDAVAVEGLDAAINRSNAYIDAGADAIFAEALTTIEDMQRFTQGVSVPVLVNLTEFGKTPLLSPAELKDAGVAMALYPLTAFRAANAAAQEAYRTLKEQGTQQAILDKMQTRQELYRVLDYDPNAPAEQARERVIQRREKHHG